MKSSVKNGLLASVIFSLIAVIAIQTWFMADMKDQLDELSANTVEPATAVIAAVQPENDNTASSQSQSETAENSPADSDDAQAPHATEPQQPATGYSRSPFDDDWFKHHDLDNWNPYAEIQRMQHEMDQIFNNAFGRFGSDPAFQNMQGFVTPGMDLRDEGDHFVAIVDLPGAEKDAISIDLEDQTLTVSAEQRFENQRSDEQGNIIFQERRSGSFRRSMVLPEPVVTSEMHSDYKNGVLTITIPKA